MTNYNPNYAFPQQQVAMSPQCTGVQTFPYANQGYDPTYSVLQTEYQNALIALAQTRAALEEIKNQKVRDRVEYLISNKISGCTNLVSLNSQGQATSYVPFMNAIIEKVWGYYSDNGELGALVIIVPRNTKERTYLVIPAKDLSSTTLVNKIQIPKAGIVANCSKSRAARLLLSLIKNEMNPDDLLLPKGSAGWYLEKNMLQYIDGHNMRPIDSNEIAAKCLLRYNGELTPPDAVINEVFNLLQVFKTPSYGALLLMFCIGGFMKSIILRNDWCPDMTVCFCGNGINIKHIIDSFISIWADRTYLLVNTATSEKNFEEAATKQSDELLIVDCEEELLQNQYREKQRKANIQMAAKWSIHNKKCFPLLISNKAIDICRMDNLIPIILEKEDIQWDIWEQVKKKPFILANFLNLIRCYAEEIGPLILEQISVEIDKQYAVLQSQGTESAELIAIFRTIALIMQDSIRWQKVDEAVIRTFSAICNEAIELHKTSTPHQEFIMEEFIGTMKNLAENHTFLFWNRDNEYPASCKNERFLLYYDQDYIYMSIDSFKNVVLKSMQEAKKNSIRILSALEEVGILSRYKSKDFCVDVSIKGLCKRKSMLRFKRKEFNTIGELDIVQRGKDYE